MSSYEDSSHDKSDFWTEDMPRLVNLLRKMRLAGTNEGGKQKIMTLRQIAECLEPSYDTFYCPLTKKIMEDPVTIESGETYEKRAIDGWFDDHGLICPRTGTEVENRDMSSNLSLKVTIREWRKKNEDVRIKLACVALTIGSSNSMVIEAMRDLQHVCKRRVESMELARELGAMRLLAQFLDFESSKTRREALKALAFFAGDDEGKERIRGTKKIEKAIRSLSSYDPSEQDAAASFLLELTKSVDICRRVGLVPGAILKLITMKINSSCEDALTDKVTEILKNLEKFNGNIKLMAEDGYLEPLLNKLDRGLDETRMEVLNLIGSITIPHHTKEQVAQQATSTLLNMAQHPDPRAQLSALQALVQLSSHPSSAMILVESGVVPLMIQSMFMGSTLIMPTAPSVHHHSAILADILENLQYEPELLNIDSQGHTMCSHYAIYNLTHMLSLKNAPHALTLNILRILTTLMSSKSKKPSDRIVKAVRETDTISIIVDLTPSPHDPLAVTSLKFLTKLAPHMGSTISQRLLVADGLLPSLLQPLDPTRVTEKLTAMCDLLTMLPHNDLSLNKALLHAVPSILNCINELQSNGRPVMNRQAKLFVEGLVGVLVRLTATPRDDEIRKMLVEIDAATIFTKLLGGASEEVLSLSAMGLRNLSMATMNQSKPTNPVEEKSRIGFLLCCFGQRRSGKDGTNKNNNKCVVHRGMCSSTTFCLVKTGGAIERLVACMEHESEAVVDAAMSALCTLLEGNVDVEQGMRVLGETRMVKVVLGVLRELKGEEVKRRALWVIERFLVFGEYGDYIDEITNDNVLNSVLVSGLHHRDGDVRVRCENILRSLKKMPNSSRHASTS